jgi:TonB family protein
MGAQLFAAGSFRLRLRRVLPQGCPLQRRMPSNRIYDRPAIPEEAHSANLETFEARPAEQELFERPQHRRISQWWWAGGLAVVLAIGPYAWLSWKRPTVRSPDAEDLPATAAPVAPKLDFNATREERDWRLAWNREAVAKLDPIGAMLTIKDGGSERSEFLQPIDLAAGFILYVAHGSDLVFTLKVTGSRGEAEERVRVLGAEQSAAAVPPPSETVEPPPPRAVATAAPAVRPEVPSRKPPEVMPPPTSNAQSEPTPIRMMAAVWPRGVPRRFPVDVQIRVWVDASGRVIRAMPAPGTSASSDFTASAIAAARLWRFAPAADNGRLVTGETTLTIKFRP